MYCIIIDDTNIPCAELSGTPLELRIDDKKHIPVGKVACHVDIQAVALMEHELSLGNKIVKFAIGLIENPYVVYESIGELKENLV